MDSESISNVLKSVKDEALDKHTTVFNLAQRVFGTTNQAEQTMVLYRFLEGLLDRQFSSEARLVDESAPKRNPGRPKKNASV